MDKECLKYPRFLISTRMQEPLSILDGCYTDTSRAPPKMVSLLVMLELMVPLYGLLLPQERMP